MFNRVEASKSATLAFCYLLPKLNISPKVNNEASNKASLNCISLIAAFPSWVLAYLSKSLILLFIAWTSPSPFNLCNACISLNLFINASIFLLKVVVKKSSFISFFPFAFSPNKEVYFNNVSALVQASFSCGLASIVSAIPLLFFIMLSYSLALTGSPSGLIRLVNPNILDNNLFTSLV